MKPPTTFVVPAGVIRVFMEAPGRLFTRGRLPFGARGVTEDVFQVGFGAYADSNIQSLQSVCSKYTPRPAMLTLPRLSSMRTPSLPPWFPLLQR